MTGASTQWRKDIGALRGVAIILVLFSHAEIPGFTFGFVGVDIFFVISGFLITKTLYLEYIHSDQSLKGRAGTINIINFYLKRFRRLAPAAIFVLFFVNLAGLFLLNKQEQEILRLDTTVSLLLVSNVKFLIEGRDYFSLENQSILQHFWSLSIEEQYYIFIPCLFLASAHFHKFRFRKKYLRFNFRIFLFFSLIFVISFLTMHLMFQNSPVQTYFSLFSRAWELAFGSMMGILACQKSRGRAFSKWEKNTPLILSMILCSFFLNPQNWPLFTIFPVLGTGFFLYAGEVQNESIGDKGNNAGKVNSIFMYFGKISYSLYLTHWPINLFLQKFFKENFLLNELCEISVAILLGHFVWSLVERPSQRIPIPNVFTRIDIEMFNWVRKRRNFVFGVPIFLLAAIYLSTYPQVSHVLFRDSQLTESLTLNRFLKPYADYESELVRGSTSEKVAASNTVAVTSDSNSAHAQLEASFRILSNAAAEKVKSSLSLTQIPTSLQSKLTNVEDDKSPFEKSPCPSLATAEIPPSCIFKSPTVGIKKRVVLIGDSKLGSFTQPIIEYFLSKNWDVYAYVMNGCNPLDPNNALNKSCKDRLAWGAKQAITENFDLMIFSGYPSGKITFESQKYLTNLIEASKHSILIGVMTQTQAPSSCVQKNFFYLQECSRIIPDQVSSFRKINLIYSSLQSNTVSYLNSMDWFCVDSICPIVQGKTFTTRDGSHPTYTFIRQIQPLLVMYFDMILKKL